MPAGDFIEAEFLIPIVRDNLLSDGRKHSTKTWNLFDDQLWDLFGGVTKAPGLYEGFYRDPDSGERVRDQSRKFIVACESQRLSKLRSLLSDACVLFQQKCIYLSVAGQVEFIGPPQQNHEKDSSKLP
jgi:hypothetical protein